jgi:ribosomal protein L37AE/L43A
MITRLKKIIDYSRVTWYNRITKPPTHPAPKKTMKCPQCQSSETYRKSLESMIIHCDNCGHQWFADQSIKPLASAHRRQGRHLLHIHVYLCPINKNKYSFAINKSGGVRHFGEYESDPYLSGCYNSIKEALEAGIKEEIL